MPAETEAEAIARLAVNATTADKIDATAGEAGVIVYPAGHQVHEFDHQHLLDAPRRATGTVAVHDAPSLITYIRRHGGRGDTDPGEKAGHDLTTAVLRVNAEAARTAIYADVDKISITGVINGNGAGPDAPGWGDHRAVLTLRYAPEWTHWANCDRKWLAQTEFAEHLEEGFGEIVNPSAADMLELAQTLQANNRVDFRSQNVLANGQRQFTYHETIEAKAGQKGTIVIPQQFQLGLIVFEGQTEGYRVDARFQFRLNDGALRVRYLLVRPHEVIRSAFDDVVTEVERGTHLAAFRGIAPR